VSTQAAAAEAPPRKLAYRPELDGVRAIAVLAVLLYHLAPMSGSIDRIARGGFLGVDVFFVLSGMLITDLLVADARVEGSRLQRFYLRRTRRLIPAVVVMLAVAVIYYQVRYGTAGAILHGLGSLVLFVTTGHWFGGQFPGGISHVWTLIVEWEYYLVWPVVLLFLLARGVSKKTLAMGAFATAIGLTIARAAAYHASGGDWNVNYHLAWLRFDELLVGCAVTLAASSMRITPPNWVRTAGLVVIFGTIALTRANTGYLYEGGMLAVALGTAAVVAPRDGAWWADRILASPPMVWIGKLSYSIYLWSVPVITEVVIRRSWSPHARIVLGVAVTFVLSAGSYYLVERRFRLPSRRAAGAETDPVLPEPVTQ
jgi:peptidoglycan/LPS O-acetylase OafA/YrhL